MAKISQRIFFICLLLFPIMLLAQSTAYKNISNDELKNLLEQGVVLIDIRREEEWQQTGIVEGSHTITLFDREGRAKADFIPRLKALVGEETPVILICRSGNRTRVASKALSGRFGFKNVYSVEKGITHWIRSGLPVVKFEQ